MFTSLIVETIKDVMEYVYESVTHESRDKEANVKKKITELKKKLEAIEERFAIGEINTEIYVKFSKKYKSEIDELEKEIHREVFRQNGSRRICRSYVPEGI